MKQLVLVLLIFVVGFVFYACSESAPPEESLSKQIPFKESFAKEAPPKEFMSKEIGAGAAPLGTVAEVYENLTSGKGSWEKEGNRAWILKHTIEDKVAEKFTKVAMVLIDDGEIVVLQRYVENGREFAGDELRLMFHKMAIETKGIDYANDFFQRHQDYFQKKAQAGEKVF